MNVSTNSSVNVEFTESEMKILEDAKNILENTYEELREESFNNEAVDDYCYFVYDVFESISKIIDGSFGN